MIKATTWPLNLPRLSPSNNNNFNTLFFPSKPLIPNPSTNPPSLRPIRASIAMETDQSSAPTSSTAGSGPAMKLLFVEMGVGYDQHGQDVTAAAMRACRDAISSNSIPAFRRGSIPGVAFDQMKLHIKLGVPHRLHQSLHLDKWENP